MGTRMTNADKLRAMTDEELAIWLTQHCQSCEICAPEYYCDLEAKCADGVLLWLKKEVKNDKH